MEFKEMTLCGGRVRGTILSVAVGVVLPLALIVFLVAFFTDQWSRADLQTDLGWSDVYMTGGLWRRCDYIGSTADCRSLVGNEETSTTFLAAQGLFIVSVFCYMIATIACGSYLLVTRFQRDQRVAITVNALLYLAATLSIAGCITYNAGTHADLEAMVPDHTSYLSFQLLWGFGIAIFYTVLTAALAVFMSVEITRSRNMIPA